MKYVLLMNDNSYVGRQYALEMKKHGIEFDVIVVGKYSEMNSVEEERCGGKWRPPLLSEIVDASSIYCFDKLNSDSTIQFLKKEKYDLAIQGGVGIIKPEVIESFTYGIMNFHPGDLPQYRGCSAPEWQIWDNNPVVCTCHMIDSGIDTGRIYKKKRLDVCMHNYELMRSSIYKEIAVFLCEILDEIDDDFLNKCEIQNEKNARYCKYIGDDKIALLKEKMQSIR